MEGERRWSSLGLIWVCNGIDTPLRASCRMRKVDSVTAGPCISSPPHVTSADVVWCGVGDVAVPMPIYVQTPEPIMQPTTTTCCWWW